MKQYTKSVEKKKALYEEDPLTEALRGKVREMIFALVDAELTEVLAALPYERTLARQGYRNGNKVRSLTTGLGKTQIEIPRGRLINGCEESEWESRLVRRYERRAASVDAALIGAYFSGANQRRIKGALSPLLRGAPLSKSAISRLVGRISALFEEWRKRSLSEERISILYLDAIALRARIADKVGEIGVSKKLGSEYFFDLCERPRTRNSTLTPIFLSCSR